MKDNPSHELPNIKLRFTLYSFRQRLLQERTYFKCRLGHKDFYKKGEKGDCSLGFF